jgi:hypothetical protein
LKGKRKAAAFQKPVYSKKIAGEYKGREDEIPEREKKKLADRLAAWELRQTAQNIINEVNYDEEFEFGGGTH